MLKTAVRKAALTLALAAAATATCPAQAQGYPDRPVKLEIPFSAGGGTDLVGRLIAQKLSTEWHQSVIPENRPGANTLIGTEFVARSPADGYTLLMASPSHTINASLYKNNIKFSTEGDFAGAAMVASGPLVLVVNNSVPANSVQELIALAKKEPGKITYGSAGTGSSPHLAGALFEQLAGVHMVHVPYKGTAPSIADLLGGQINASFSPLPGVIQYIQQGKLKALGVTSAKRFPTLPNVPTIAEAGVKGYEVEQWWGIVVPKATPKAVIDKINRDVAKAVQSKAAREQLATMGAVPGSGTPQQFDAMIHNEIQQWAKLVDSAKIVVN